MYRVYIMLQLTHANQGGMEYNARVLYVLTHECVIRTALVGVG